MILVRYASAKNFNPVARTKPHFQLIHRSFLAFRRIDKTLSKYKVESLGSSQTKVHVGTQLFIRQNFKIVYYSFFKSALVGTSLKRHEKQRSSEVNPTFLSPGVDFKKIWLMKSLL